MATLGLLSPEFPSVSLSANLDAIAATGAVSVQFDLASAVGRTFPTELQDIVEAIGARFAERQLTLAALSGTYNMIDPDPQARKVGAEGLNRVIALAHRLHGTAEGIRFRRGDHPAWAEAGRSQGSARICPQRRAARLCLKRLLG
jgi:sugar phosphate isomerase/epimerase